MKFKCKKNHKTINNESIVKDRWYKLEYDDRFNSYILRFPNLQLEFKEDNQLYYFFYTIQELRKEKIKKLLNENI